MKPPAAEPLAVEPQNLLWLDFIGASATVFATGVVLTTLVTTGLPRSILMALSLLAILYAGFDVCALRFWPTSKWPLLAIGLLNLAYCIAATSVCLFYRESLTTLGAAYFFLEACIVVPLAIVEIRASKKNKCRMW